MLKPTTICEYRFNSETKYKLESLHSLFSNLSDINRCGGAAPRI
jgi:hypothetical protein